MKRIAALFLAALMLCAGVAQAADWGEGTSPAQPYEYVPAINMDEQLGYIMFYPKEGMTVETACQRLYLYLPRDDVFAGEGLISLRTAREGEIWSAKMNDESVVIRREISEPELEGLLWGGGVCYEVVLPRTLELGKTYSVNLAQGCLVSDNGKENVQISGDLWSFTVSGDYGVNGMSYRRARAQGGYDDLIANPQPGDEIRFDLVMGGDAAVAVIYGYNGSVDFLNATYAESGEVTGVVTGDEPYWGVIFLDAQGGELRRVEFW